MGRHRRLAVLIDQIPETRLVEVARIRSHLEFRHRAQNLPAARLNALFRAALGGMADFVFIVPRQRGHAHAVTVKLMHALDLALEDFAALDAQQNLHFAVLRLQRRIDALPALRIAQMLKGVVFGHRLVIRMACHALIACVQRAGLQAHAAFFHGVHRHTGRFIRLERAHIQRVAVRIANNHDDSSSRFCKFILFIH